MQQGNFINVFLARHVSGTHTHHQEHQTFNYSIWFSAPSFWMGGGLESRCVGRVYGADGAVARHHPHRSISPLLPTLDSKWRPVFTPRPRYSRERTPGCVHEPVSKFWRGEKKLASSSILREAKIAYYARNMFEAGRFFFS